MRYKVPLAYNAFGDDERAAVEAVLSRGSMTQGREVSQFEALFAAWHGIKHAILVNSGSSANLVAIDALFHSRRGRTDIKSFQRGDEIIIPGLCWPTTLTPLINHGLQPVFCDIDLRTLNISAKTVEAVRTEKARAVIAVPVVGNPEGLDELRSYCASRGLLLLEDACESLGAVGTSGRRVGTFGVAAAFSFYFSHHISTIEGGAILTDSDEIADLCYALRSHGWTRQVKHNTLNFRCSNDDVDPRFCFILPGYNVRATEITAALGTVQLAKLPEIVARRRKIAAGRIAALGSSAGRLTIPGALVCDRHSWMTFPLMFSSRRHRRAAQQYLEECGIETRPVIAGNILRHPLAQTIRTRLDQPALPACDEVFDRGLMIGLNPYSDQETEAMVNSALHEAALI